MMPARAILILAELHDFRRFHAPGALMAYLGLVPGEDSTGEKHRRGRITRTGSWSAGCWSKPRGIINTGRASEWRSRDDARGNQAV